MLHLIYHHMHKVSRHHLIGLAVISIAIAFAVTVFPATVFAIGGFRFIGPSEPFGARITATIPVPQPNNCVVRYGAFLTNKNFVSLCRTAGSYITETAPFRPCGPNAWIIGWKADVPGPTITRAWCK